MSETVEGTDREGTVLDRPAIGLIATPENEDAVLRAVLRARRLGFDVLVTHYNTPTIEAVRLAEDLGARVLLPRHPDPDRETLRRVLTTGAEGGTYPGIVLLPERPPPIDYGQSVAALEGESFVADAIPESETGGSERVLIAIPAYQEAATIGDVVRGAREQADEVLVVDDGSTDGTADRARDAGATVIERGRNEGYGAALHVAFVEADRRGVDLLVVLDGDGQHDPRDVPELVDRHRETGADVVVGSRFVDGSATRLPPYRRVGIGVVNLLTNLSLGNVRTTSRIADTQSGFRAYGSRAVRSLATDGGIGDGMSASTDILYHANAHDLRVEEVAVTVDYDVQSANTHHPVAHGATLVNNLLKTLERERPMTVLGVPGFGVCLFGIVLGFWTVSTYEYTGTLPGGATMLASFAILIGFLACFTGIILHSLNTRRFDETARTRNPHPPSRPAGEVGEHDG